MYFKSLTNFIALISITLQVIFGVVQQTEARARFTRDHHNLSRDENINKTAYYSNVNGALDRLIEMLYGDIEPKSVLFREPLYASHAGLDNALHYTNEWVVHIDGGDQEANRIAEKAGYVNLGQVKGFPDVYLMRKPDHPAGHKRSARELTSHLMSFSQVNWADQQFSKSRVKRDLDIMNLIKNFDIGNWFNKDEDWFGKPHFNPFATAFTDPLWDKQWYMQDTRTKASLPRLDLNVLPVFQLGYTGSGVNVVILDDGLEHTHSDLVKNYVPSISGDLNDNDDDPTPRYGTKPDNAHGTRCAGEVAMQANNSKCGVGIAYNAGIGGVRMLDGPVSDRIEGEALSFALKKVDIFSASWGPNDDGETVEGPGRLAQQAFLKGVTQGRNGLGIIYVWASGNGGAKDDTCACDGYASNVFTLSIGSASESGTFPWYGEKCPSTLAVTYSSGAYTDQKIATTDLNDQCTTSHTGTSASAPLAAGIVALVLEANPKLTWRDVQHLTVWTAQPGPLIDNPGWKMNDAGFQYNPRFGFGLMDAHGMVRTALNWTNVPAQRVCRIKPVPVEWKQINPLKPNIVEFQSDGCRGTENEINYIEHVQVFTTVHYTNRGALQIDLVSPKGTKTRLLFPRKNDVSPTGFENWPFTSAHTWGENPAGQWLFYLTDSTLDADNKGTFDSAELVIYGTKQAPQHALSGPRMYPLEYKKKSVMPFTAEKNDPQLRLRALVDNVQNWI
ncbi:Neuroendocrine convertase 1 [Orchesella cincta]|uniref:furin n=1 Tax=Orchesella cincta TaxID=48709 RepID=A0A1D2MHX2_ORCCI|nr:Neuroendocrine convertase 1 [Orchesella cincta]